MGAGAGANPRDGGLNAMIVTHASKKQGNARQEGENNG